MAEVLHTASVKFTTIREDDGQIKISCSLNAPELDRGKSEQELSAAALVAATAYRAFNDGSLLRGATKLFGLDAEAFKGVGS